MANVNPLRKTEFYNGNHRLKRADVRTPLTDFQLDELEKCEHDIIYFVENYIKIVHIDHGLVSFKPYDYQKKLLKCYEDNRNVICLSGRQSGKCCRPESQIKIRNKKTGIVSTITMGELWELEDKKRNIK